MCKWTITALAIAAIGVPAAHAAPGNWWLMSTKSWTCLSTLEAEFIAKKPDGSPRAMEQNLYQKDGTVTPLFWFAEKADCESWLARLRKNGMARPTPASAPPPVLRAP
jgi:hypothetical protein